MGRTRAVMLAVVVLAVAGLTGCNASWPFWRGDPARSGLQPNETTLSTANVGSLTRAWSAPLAGVASPVAVVGGVAYERPADNTLRAFDATGHTNCTGAPKTCTPLWTATAPVGADYTPAVANGLVYTTGAHSQVDDTADLQVFDANGTTNCGGSPRTCTPLWTAPITAFYGQAPTVANGVVYGAASDGILAAFDANGVTNCVAGSPKVCHSLWTSTPTGEIDNSAPAVAGGKVYIGENADNVPSVDVYDGQTGCRPWPQPNDFGHTIECDPIWKLVTGNWVESTPAVVDGIVYVGATDGKLYAFDANQSVNCVAAFKACAPMWTASAPGLDAVAVAGGVVYAGVTGGLEAFDAHGVTKCSGSPRVCTPLWSASLGGTGSAATVANGVVYLGTSAGVVAGFDAAGSINCTGTTTRTCTPLWTAATGGPTGAPVVVNGTVYVPAGASLQAYQLP
ncbi:MAG TPA: PQQ-binding-like beta-propeller repeat protein [Acidimicrobiia bacterium]